MKPKELLLSIALMMLVAVGAAAQDGASLYKANCAYCHTIGKGKLVGPDLKGAHTRYPEKWLMKWIKSSQALVQENDAKAVALFKKYDEVVMPDQAMSDDDLKAVIAYIKSQGGEEPVQAVKTAPVTQDKSPSAPANDQTVATTAPAPAPADQPAASPTTASVQAPAVVPSASTAQPQAKAFPAIGYMWIAFIGVLLLVILMLSNIIKSLAKQLGTVGRKV